MTISDVPHSSGVSVEVASEADGMQLQIVEVDSGGSISNHTHARPHTVVILEGTGRETGSGKGYSAGDHVLFAAHQVHGWENSSDGPFRFASVSAGPGLLNTNQGAWDMTPA